MRISDWSSDVCSSDLIDQAARAFAGDVIEVRRVTADHRTERDDAVETAVEQQLRSQRNLVGAGRAKEFDMLAGHAPGLQGGTRASDQRIDDRSEEHTSELQSLMRISYAVFCLKKKRLRQH